MNFDQLFAKATRDTANSHGRSPYNYQRRLACGADETPSHGTPCQSQDRELSSDKCRNLHQLVKNLSFLDAFEALTENRPFPWREEPFSQFSEGRFLSLLPFRDFHGRTIRAFLTEPLRRFDLPRVELAPEADAGRAQYFAALEAADRRDLRPLVDIWRDRLTHAATHS